MISLFFSYAHQDETMRDELEIHLAMLKRSGLISSWHDRRITAGAELDRTVSLHLEEADVILLLLSPHFLASEYCYDKEAARALERHGAGAAVVIPVLLQPCDWLNSPFNKLRATPKDGKPIAKYPNANDAFLEVTEDIRAAAQRLNKGDAATNVVTQPHSSGSDAGVRSSNLRLKKVFTDRERDEFVDASYTYIEKFVENSLAELRQRNPSIDFRFKQVAPTAFTAAVYVGGAKRTSCHIWLSDRSEFGGDIAYSANDSTVTNSMNEWLVSDNDGYQLGLKASGMSFTSQSRESLMTSQGAAEHFWSLFIAPLQ